MYLVIGGDGGTWGPYDFDSMRRFVAEGRVIPGTQVSVEGSNAWIPAAMVPGLFATGASPLQQPVTAVPLPPQTRRAASSRTSTPGRTERWRACASASSFQGAAATCAR